eukprot:m.87340 g.87340  ORF g.87340 m.87340 type:complete len:315 (-) comp26060_c1_seq1:273-1217(-)
MLSVTGAIDFDAVDSILGVTDVFEAGVGGSDAIFNRSGAIAGSGGEVTVGCVRFCVCDFDVDLLWGLCDSSRFRLTRDTEEPVFDFWIIIGWTIGSFLLRPCLRQRLRSLKMLSSFECINRGGSGLRRLPEGRWSDLSSCSIGIEYNEDWLRMVEFSKGLLAGLMLKSAEMGLFSDTTTTAAAATWAGSLTMVSSSGTSWVGVSSSFCDAKFKIVSTSSGLIFGGGALIGNFGVSITGYSRGFIWWWRVLQRGRPIVSLVTSPHPRLPLLDQGRRHLLRFFHSVRNAHLRYVPVLQCTEWRYQPGDPTLWPHPI